MSLSEIDVISGGGGGGAGSPGPGVAVGGVANDWLVKKSATDYDTEWSRALKFPTVKVTEEIIQSLPFLVVERMLEDDGYAPGIWLRAAATINSYPSVQFRKAGGSMSAPAMPLANTYLGGLSWGSYSGTAWVSSSSMFGFAPTDWSGTSRQTALSFWNTVAGTTGAGERMRIIDRLVAIGSTASAPASTNEKLRVNTPATPDALATAHITPTGAAARGLIVQGAASQTADLTQWQDSTGAVLAGTTSGGAFYYGTNPATSGAIRLPINTFVTWRNGGNTANGAYIGPSAGDFLQINSASAMAFLVGGVQQLSVGSGSMTLTDAVNVVVGTTTGTKIGTSATQKIGFWNTAPAVRPTGWALPTGTLARTTFDTATATLNQVAQRLAALIADLTTVGLIGA